MEVALEMRPDTDVAGIASSGATKTFNDEYLFGNIPGKGCAQHFDIHEIQKYIDQDKFNEFFKFSFVRNPWDEFVASVAWGRLGSNRLKWVDKKYVKKRTVTLAVITQLLKRLRFSMRLVNRIRHKLDCDHVKEQWRFIYDEKGRHCLVDFVGKVENLEQDWQHVCRKISNNIPLELRMKSYHKHYSYYYNFFTRHAIGFLYRQDIKLFNYQFRSPPKK